MIKPLTDADFDSETADKEVAILFSASWCQPCKTLTPYMNSIQDELSLSVFKVDIDEATETAARFKIRGVPTMIRLHNGLPVESATGGEKIRTLLDSMR